MSFLFKCAILRFSSQPGLSLEWIMCFVVCVCVCVCVCVSVRAKLRQKKIINIISVIFRQRCQG